MKDNIEALRDEKVIARIAQLHNMGMSPTDISKELKDSLSVTSNPKTIKNLMKEFQVTTSIFSDDKKHIEDLFEKTMVYILEELKKNCSEMGGVRDKLKEVMKMIEAKQVLEGNSDRKFLIMLRELRETIKTQDNSLDKLIKYLDLLDKQKTKVTRKATASVEVTMDDLIEYEEAGIISINPRYKKKKKIENAN